MISQRPTHLKSLLWIALLALTSNFVVAPPRSDDIVANDDLSQVISNDDLVQVISVGCAEDCSRDGKLCCSSSGPDSDRFTLDLQCRAEASCQLRDNIGDDYTDVGVVRPTPVRPTPGGDRYTDVGVVRPTPGGDRNTDVGVVRPTPGGDRYLVQIPENCAQDCGIDDDLSVNSACFTECLLNAIAAVGGNNNGDRADEVDIVGGGGGGDAVSVFIPGFGVATVLVGSFFLYNRKRKQEAPAVNEFQADVELDSDVELEMDSVVDAEETS